MNFNARLTTLLQMPMSPLTWDSILKECDRLESEFLHIPSSYKWTLDYLRFQVERERGNQSAALWHLKAAIATAPYNNDILGDYKNVVKKTSGIKSLALIITSKRTEARALRLAVQFDSANIEYMIVSGADTQSIAHVRAVQVDVSDSYESTPQKVVTALTWVYENIGANVGVMKVDDSMILENPERLRQSLSQLARDDAYVGVPSATLEHDRCLHWGLCNTQDLNRRVYGRPVLRAWAAGGAYYLGAGPLSKVVFSLLRFPGLFEGEYYDDKLIGDVLVFEGVELSNRDSYADFGLAITDASTMTTAAPAAQSAVTPVPASAPALTVAIAPTQISTPAPVPASASLSLAPAQQVSKPASGSEPIYLHLGCGSMNFPGFVNIDMGTSGADVNLDLTGPLPWGDRTVTGIFSEHFIEHITQAQGIRLLMECRRTLLPGGVVRMATPDLAETVRHYNENYLHPDLFKFDLAWTENRCERMNIAMRWWGHQWMYDEEELIRIGKLVGFSVRGRFELGQSSDPMLMGREYRDSSTLIIEFEKPDRQVKADENPLVSIVIPAYNPRYFRQSLESAINQTYQNLDILVCDDSLADGILDIVKEYQEKDARIRYLRNTVKTDVPGRPNHILCFNEARGDFIKFLNDDDLLVPHCVERLLNCFIENPDLVLATSKRQRIDATGNHLPDIAATQSPFEHDTLIEGLKLGVALITTKLNFVGEPTTALFRRSELIDVKPDFGSIDKWEVSGMFDVAVWLNLLTRGNAVYVVEPLSYFRIHNEQAQVVYADACHAGAKDAWTVIEKAWRRLGFLT